MLRHRYSDLAEHVNADPLCVLLGYSGRVEEGHLVELIAYRKYGVEARHRLLEYHRDVLAADFVHFARRGPCYIVGYVVPVRGFSELAGVEAYLPLDDLPLRSLHKLHYREGGDRLSAAGLTDDADYLSFRNIKRHAVYRHYGSVIGEKAGFEAVYLDKVIVVSHGCCVFGERFGAALFRLVVLHPFDVLADYFPALFY